MKTKLKREAAIKFIAWALEQIDAEKELYREANEQGMMSLMDEVEWGLKVICEEAKASKMFDQIREKI